MKNLFITILVSFVFQQWQYCQEISFPIRTYLPLWDLDTIKHPEFSTYYKDEFLNEKKKRFAQSIVFTKLDSNLMRKIYQNFIRHVEINKKVKSYYYPGYDIGLKQIDPHKINALNNPNLTQRFDKYFSPLDYDELEWINGGTNDGNWVQITPNSLLKYSCDSTLVTSVYPPYDVYDTVVCRYMRPENTEGLIFVEIWNFNKVTGRFVKKTEFVSLNLFDAEIGGVALLSFKANSESSENIFKENMRYDVFFDLWNTCNPYAEYSCDNVRGEFSRSASTSHYINPENRTELILGIFNAVETGMLIPLDAKLYDDKGREKVLKIDQMYDCMEFAEKVKVMRPYPPYEEKDTTVIRLSQFSDIIGIRFIEDWSFEAEKFNFYKKVKTFALLFATYDNMTGELTGYKPLFYLKPKD